MDACYAIVVRRSGDANNVIERLGLMVIAQATARPVDVAHDRSSRWLSRYGLDCFGAVGSRHAVDPPTLESQRTFEDGSVELAYSFAA